MSSLKGAPPILSTTSLARHSLALEVSPGSSLVFPDCTLATATSATAVATASRRGLLRLHCTNLRSHVNTTHLQSGALRMLQLLLTVQAGSFGGAVTHCAHHVGIVS